MINQSTIDKLIEMRLTSMADAFRIQMDDLYSFNSEGKSILIRKEERPKP